MASSQKKRIDEAKETLRDLSKGKGDGIQAAKQQLRTAAKVAAVALLVVWLLALGFAKGLDSVVPYWIAAILTIAAAVATALILRNLKKSEELGALLADGAELNEEERKAQIAKLDAAAGKGDPAAIMAKAQLQMQDSPKDALVTLETVNLEKVPKLVAMQVRAMRAMVHLNLGEVKAARELADAIDLSKAPDPKSRGNLAAVVAESWARSGNPIEASELLDKYNPDEKDFEDIRVQLLRARVFASAHKQDLNTMRRTLKALVAVSPHLLAMFVAQKRIHPLLEKEARKALEKSGLAPRQRVQFARR